MRSQAVPGEGAATRPDVRASWDAISAIWPELQAHLSRSKTLCLVILYSDDVRELRRLRSNVEGFLAQRSRALFAPSISDPAHAADVVLAALRGEAEVRSAVRRPIWLELLRVDVEGRSDWEVARQSVLSRLNEWRNWLQTRYRSPLFVALPAEWRARVPEVAPDLWHVRTFTAVVPTVQPRLDAVEEDLSSLRRPSIRAAVETALEPHLQRVANARASLGFIDLAATRRELAVALGGLSAAERNEGFFEAAAKSANESVEILRYLRERNGDPPGDRHDLAESLDRAASAELKLGLYEEALRHCNESLELRRELTRLYRDDPQLLRGYSISLNKIADVELEQGQIEKSIAHLREALEVRKRLLAKFGANPTTLRDLWYSLMHIGKAESRSGRVEAAVAAFQEALSTSRYRWERMGDEPIALQDLALTLQALADAERNAGRLDAALAAYRESVAVARRVPSPHADTPLLLHNFALLLLGLGSVERELGNLGAAQAAFREAIDVSRQMRTELGDASPVLGTLADGLSELAKTNCEDAGFALPLLDEAIALREQLTVPEGRPEESEGEKLREARRIADALRATVKEHT